MDISLREWLIIIGVLIILGVIIDGLRRMRLGRKDQLQMSRRLGGDLGDASPLDEMENPELPTRGFRVIRRGEDSAKYAEAARAFEQEQAQAREHHERVEPGFDEDGGYDKADEREGDPLGYSEQVELDEQVEDDERSGRAYASDEFEEGDYGRGNDSDDDDIDSDDRYDNAETDAHEPLMSEADSAFTTAGEREAVEQPMHAEDDEDDRGSRSGGVGRKASGPAGLSSASGKTAAPKEESRFKERFLQKMEPVRRMTEKVQSISRAKQQQQPAKPASKLQHLTVVNVVSKDEQGFDGATLDRILKAVGMQRTAQDTFVRHEDDFDEGEVQFTLVNAVEPGTFPKDMISFRTPCLALILVLPGPDNTIQAFDYMIEIAQVIVKNCNGELLDADHSAMTSQTIEHHRQSIREFERKSRSVKV
ncbi:cell division protein ZipA C-terminal FtsZ-binding domain-containing protein [Allohahella marinimesophila]|uniref:Cell division protein ZipA n=1 Tax=Allohahella marinimesophila TaxID=1054972 RepID=A0ABP7QCC1_9GAMM